MASVSSLLGRSPGDSNINRSVQTWNYVCQSLCIIGMTVCFGLRVYTRAVILNGFNKEDLMCAAAWLLGTGYSVIAMIMGHYGGGLHLDDVPPENVIPFEKTVYVTMVMYGPTAYLTKFCLLWIMTRVFSPFRKAVIFIYVFMGVMLAYYIPAVIVKIRICNPIGRFWNKNIQGTCLNETSIILADAVVSMVSDLIILLLPLPLTMSLQMPKKKKMRVIGLLGAGGLAVTASVIRLALIVTTGQSKDATYAFMRINMLGNAEVAMGVICTCLPALSALLIRAYHEYSSNKATSTSKYRLSTIQTQSKTQRSKQKMSVLEAETDEDVLMYNAQGNPRVETTVQGDTERQVDLRGSPFLGGIGITRTVDVSTSVETR
ncbi:hypothetical protein N7448_000654 [Penicillium atrosanguineum]|uniref:Rhodopsin domain-containing protein n=1 Tax=Penicillium atrosanguineum TaxID=1132637 RepID=A0A9W9HKY4_9EURO|nr:uncharacterized protein N7443_004049 [Penicillium atrosanguineum]KAJ5149076.1 hypothetical protein N7448_000654 [Penicillium atrosanguineum]KAJ5304389.1 hypothetical protein N7443_004049 [Penicillium atrosanguineum]KAJ5323862.1 hypothetical protein N7476_002462 [Penicillium atrosanguineum]